jgi:hypothetical protein
MTVRHDDFKMSQRMQIEVPVNSLALWNLLMMKKTIVIKKNIQHVLDFAVVLACSGWWQ